MAKDLNGKELGRGISQRKDLTYMGRFVDKQGKRRALYDKNLKRLIRRLEKARYESENGIYGTGEDVSLEDWFELYLILYKEGRVKVTTLYRMRQTFAPCKKESLGKRNLRDIRAFMIQELINELHERECTYGTLKLLKSLLNDMFKMAMGNGLVVTNPCDAVILPLKEECKEMVLTQDELNRFLDAAVGYRHYEIFCVLASTGMRIGEVLGLKWSDVDFEKNTITVARSLHYGKTSDEEKCHFFFTTTKTKASSRTIPLLPETKKVFERVKEIQCIERGQNAKLWKEEEPFDDMIFTCSCGMPVRYGDLNRALKKIIARANVKEMELAKIMGREACLIQEFSPHCFRHTFVTLCKKKGIPYEHIQLYVGHSEKEMTKYYDHNKTEITAEDFKDILFLENGTKME